jgi:hypothetical protein
MDDQGGQLTALDRCWARRTGGEKSIENVVVDLQMQRHSAFLRDLYRVAASNSKD